MENYTLLSYLFYVDEYTIYGSLPVVFYEIRLPNPILIDFNDSETSNYYETVENEKVNLYITGLN